MPAASQQNLSQFLGREPERLTPKERLVLAGKWMAVEMYSPATLPLLRMEAIGESVADCARQLAARSLDPRKFEFSLIQAPW